MSHDNRDGTCITGKVRYADDKEAAEALARVREVRMLRPDGKPPERIFYACRECGGWHLSSRLPAFDSSSPAQKADGETWEEYAKRLERRISEQREHIESIHGLREEGNRQARKKIDGLIAALGRMTVRWEREREQKLALVAKLPEILDGPDSGQS